MVIPARCAKTLTLHVPHHCHGRFDTRDEHGGMQVICATRRVALMTACIVSGSADHLEIVHEMMTSNLLLALPLHACRS